MPDIVKIGRTMRDVASRARDLFTSGVPGAFVIDASVLSPDCEHLEIMMHEHFQKERVSENREFFRISTNNAEVELLRLQKFQLECWISDFNENLAVVNELELRSFAKECVAHDG